MTGRENLRRAIEFKSPDYLPHDLPADFAFLREQDAETCARIQALQQRMPRDTLALSACIDRCEQREGKTFVYDEWGTVWMDEGRGLVTYGYPLEEEWDALDVLPLPDAQHPARFAQVDQTLATNPDAYRIGTVWYTLFERLWLLRNMENMLTDPHLYPDEFQRLQERVVEVNLAMIDEWLKRDIDGIYFSDDWGAQTTTLISPEDFLRHYYDGYRSMFRRVRDAGKHVWLHSCGNITNFIPYFIDLGVQVLNPVQSHAMDVRKLAREFGGRICFNGGIDVQGIAARQTPEGVRRALHELAELFGSHNGGYIVNTTHSLLPGTPARNVEALYDEYLTMIGR